MLLLIHLLSIVGCGLAFTATMSRFQPRSSVYNCNRSERIALAQSGTLFDEIATDDIRDLPIYDILDSVREAASSKANLLLEAAPGAGKTTVVPLLMSSLLSGEERQNVIVVEPRRVATRSAAQRMSNLINQRVGDAIGYAVRGESRQSSQTSVLVMTDGVLLNMLREDPELTGYQTVILDEFHERGVGSDTALALLREVQANYRPDLKVVVMSATLLGSGNGDKEQSAGAKLLRVLGGPEECNVLESEGRQFPIQYQHSGRASPRLGALLRDTKLLVSTMANAIEEGLSRAPDKGDVLAFLPGAKEIRRVTQELRSRGLGGVDVFPLFGALPKPEQDRAIFREESIGRRVIVSSPIAEASLTIEGVTCVVDSGLQRQPKYDANTGLPHLVTVMCSKDSAVQRAGRAGRTREGYCVRLFSEAEFDKLPEHATLEICSTDMVPTTLLLSEWGCTSAKEVLEDLPFIDPPPKAALDKAYQMLVDLGALEEYRLTNSRRKRYKVTVHGDSLVRLPTHPRFATSIMKAAKVGEAPLASAIAAAALMDQDLIGSRETNIALAVRHLLRESPGSFNGKQLLNFASRISDEARSSVLAAMSSDLAAQEASDCAGIALLPGFIDLIAQRKGDASYGGSTYMLSLGQSARLDGKPDEGEYILVVDTSTGDDGKTRIRSYAKIDSAVLQEVACEKEEVYAVATKGYLVRKRRVMKVGSLVLDSTTLPSPSSEEVTEVLLDTIDSLGGVAALIPMQSKKNGVALTELQRRVNLARRCASDDEWPPCFASLEALQGGDGLEEDERIMTEVIEPWLGAAASLKDLDLRSILQMQITAEQQNQLDRYFPASIEAPDGSSIPISYDSETGPVASAKLQQFFGQQESPTVGPPGKTIPVSLSLLSPAGKPLAQTIDLPFFWSETYPSVRAEMRGRYPKHPWPEDPTTAVASRLTKKQQQIHSGDGNAVPVDKRKERNKQRKKKR
ncbi:hypothetical protein ACHAXT_003574 [Thalassiosira profunda]